MQPIIPPKLRTGDIIRVIAPSMSMAIIPEASQRIAVDRLEKHGFKITFGKHVMEKDDFNSSLVEARIADLHDAFSDTTVKAILCATGGFNSNQLLKHIDWDLIKQNPKIICGKSDITVLNDAIYAKTGVVTYSGPNLWTLDGKHFEDYYFDYWEKCLLSDKPFLVEPPAMWNDWDEETSEESAPEKNEGFWILQEGSAEGTILGSNMATFTLLKGSDYFPPMDNALLFLEDDFEEDAMHVDCLLQSLIIEKSFSGVKGIVFGRFQKKSNITREQLQIIVNSKPELHNLPIIGNVDIGHTMPIITFPVGGTARINVHKQGSIIEILEH